MESRPLGPRYALPNKQKTNTNIKACLPGNVMRYAIVPTRVKKLEQEWGWGTMYAAVCARENQKRGPA